MESGDCFHCSLADSCLPQGLNMDGRAVLERHVSHEVGRPRHLLCRTGQPYSGIYIIRTGMVKRYRAMQNERRNFREYIVDFPARGELVGLEAMGTGVFQYSAQVLETSSLCFFSKESIDSLFRIMPTKVRDIIRMSSSLYTNAERRNTPRMPEEKVASFLLEIADKRRWAGMSLRRFTLPMKRREIADYLLIATETLSRVLKALQARGVIRIKRKDVEILDPEALEALARQGLPAPAMATGWRYPEPPHPVSPEST